MAKKVVSFAIEPDEKERIDAVIKRRRSAPGGADRELKFSKWMRDAVIEKLHREEVTLHIAPTLLAADDPESYKARGRRAGEK